MFFNGNYFDILLFCIMAALLLKPFIKHGSVINRGLASLAGYLKKESALLYSGIKTQKPGILLLNLAIMILVSVFLCHDRLLTGGFSAAMVLFLQSFLKVLGISLLLMLITYVYFKFISAFYSIGASEKRLLTQTMLIIIIIMERHAENSIFTIAVFTLNIFFFYCINMLALFRTVGMAKRKTVDVRTIWLNVVGIIGMFILLFSVLYYCVGNSFPGAFNRSLSLLDSVYFTLVSFATIGFGDIVATSAFTKTITIVNALTSISCLVFLVNAIMSLTSTGEDGSQSDTES